MDGTFLWSGREYALVPRTQQLRLPSANQLVDASRNLKGYSADACDKIGNSPCAEQRSCKCAFGGIKGGGRSSDYAATPAALVRASQNTLAGGDALPARPLLPLAITHRVGGFTFPSTLRLPRRPNWRLSVRMRRYLSLFPDSLRRVLLPDGASRALLPGSSPTEAGRSTGYWRP